MVVSDSSRHPTHLQQTTLVYIFNPRIHQLCINWSSCLSLLNKQSSSLLIHIVFTKATSFFYKQFHFIHCCFLLLFSNVPLYNYHNMQTNFGLMFFIESKLLFHCTPPPSSLSDPPSKCCRYCKTACAHPKSQSGPCLALCFKILVIFSLACL